MYRRHRKLRKSLQIRNLIKDVYLEKSDLIYPLFIEEGENIRKEISSMPGVYRYSLDRLNEELEELKGVGITSVLLFGIPEHKDACASGSYDREGIIQKAIRYIKKGYPEFMVIGDICCCEYTDHGHCGIINEDGYVENDRTLEILGEIALSYAESGVDIVAPSDMMDGRVEKIITVLEENGYGNIPVMSYAVKYSSSFYGPFREAADSAPKFGDRKTYQMDFKYTGDVLSEVEEDIRQGADMIIVKPGLAYLDILKEVKENFNIPVIAYNVSGEYSMIKAAALNGWINEKEVVMEQLYAFKRAGANGIITYFAKDAAKYMDKSV